jgi:hypothetical protein
LKGPGPKKSLNLLFCEHVCKNSVRAFTRFVVEFRGFYSRISYSARMEPDGYARRYGEVVWRLKEKGAVEVVGCELKCMAFMNVTPYSNAIHSLCVGLDTVKTQIGISHLAKDGYHILPSCITMLAKTYACAIMGVCVPCPLPACDSYRDPNLRGRWPTPQEARDQGNRHGLG